ncbi:MAG: fumarylacetoacetate hydrolase family protein [FCB group bacterium]|nr:fumarylacetoacetate hydrolase family protein [FCB group bacterium]
MNAVILDYKKIYPSKIICAGRNYVGHIRELNNEIPSEPVIFIKPNSAITTEIHSGHKDEIHYEAEITLLIISGKIHAVGFGLDLTKREVQTRLKKAGLPWERAKAFDGSAVFSEFVPVFGITDNLKIELHINDKLIQKGSSDLMLTKPQQLLEEIKSFITLEDGDLIMTGTPQGVGKVNSGDQFVGRIFEKDRKITEGSWQVK